MIENFSALIHPHYKKIVLIVASVPRILSISTGLLNHFKITKIYKPHIRLPTL